MILLVMNLKKLITVFSILILLSSCQSIKEKSDAIAEKENREYGKLVGRNITELKIELGNPTEYKNNTMLNNTNAPMLAFELDDI